MKIRINSDLHNDVSVYTVPAMKDDLEIVYVVAGDIDMAKCTNRYTTFLYNCSQQFKHVIIVLGNHEYWGSNIIAAVRKIRDICARFDNVTVLHNDSIVLDNVAFIGSTLWTNIRNPLVELQVETQMNDYKKIRTGPVELPWKRKLRVSDTVREHVVARNYIFDAAKQYKEQGLKTFVVTHHAPSMRSLSPKYPNDPCNPAYYSELDMDIMDVGVDYWVHGHIHWQSDYYIEQCRVICNPRGYSSEKHGAEFTSFLEEFIMEI